MAEVQMEQNERGQWKKPKDAHGFFAMTKLYRINRVLRLFGLQLSIVHWENDENYSHGRAPTYFGLKWIGFFTKKLEDRFPEWE